jgi:hypothetical protein
MRNQRIWLSGTVIGILILVLAAGFATAQTKPTPPPAKEKVVDEVTLTEVQSVLGIARDDHSGVADFSRGNNGEVIIAYRYYDVDLTNYETDFASEITPKIQQMYKRFKNFNRIRFQIVTNNPAAPPLWIPFSEFAIDRKTIEDLHYTWFVARYILDQTLKNKR